RPNDPRLAYFHELLEPNRRAIAADALYADYVRIARFLYRKEFQGSETPRERVAEVAELYRTRPHSSDTQIEAGFGVYIALGALHGLDSVFRVRRLLVVGPGMDLAPRTALIHAVPTQSYQPLAVADAPVAFSLPSP